jgi:hypothetical protein
VRWLVVVSLLAVGGWATAQDRPIAPAAKPAAAAVATKGPAWNQLTPPQRQALAPLERDWPSLDAAGKSKWLEVATRLPSLPPLDRQRVQERMAEWSKLSPAERGRARLQFQESRQVMPSDRKAQWDAYQTLPEETRRELALRARPAAPARLAPAAADNARPGTPATAATPRRDVESASRTAAPKAVTPTVVQARPGATTTLLTQRAVPPLHQQAGLPKIAATEGFVNPSTLLPKRGPQGAAVRSAAASAADTRLP